MTIKLTPKDTFRADKPAAQAHSDITAGTPFQNAASVALLEYQFRMASGEPTVAAVTAFKLRGAQEFLAILLNLGEPDDVRQPLGNLGLTPPERDEFRMS